MLFTTITYGIKRVIVHSEDLANYLSISTSHNIPPINTILLTNSVINLQIGLFPIFLQARR